MLYEEIPERPNIWRQISGGNGNDILTGGASKDHFNSGAGTDTITDFQPGVDTKTANCENS